MSFGAGIGSASRIIVKTAPTNDISPPSSCENQSDPAVPNASRKILTWAILSRVDEAPSSLVSIGKDANDAHLQLANCVEQKSIVRVNND